MDTDLHLDALRQRKLGPSDEAIASHELLARLTHFRPLMLYRVAELHLQRGEPQKAADALRRLQATFPIDVLGFFVAWYPRSFYLLGKAHERAGDTAAALIAYEKFLAIWKNADPDLAELQDAKARVAALRR